MNPAFVNAPEMLPMPPRIQPTAAQLAGAACCWCAGPTELALGPRLRIVDGRPERWFPRACRPCAGEAAARVAAVHVRTCAHCTSREYCPDLAALRALAAGHVTAGSDLGSGPARPTH